MGLLAIGVGISGVAAWGALLHLLAASLAKAALFLVAGSILIRYGTRLRASVAGMSRILPVSGFLFVAGLFALTGSPPFGTFPSELALLSGAVHAGRLVLAVVMLVLQITIFAAMISAVLGMTLGEPDASVPRAREDRWLILPPAVLLGLALGLGVWLPPGIQRALAEAAASIGGVSP
jgi:hydrogenase-4 component F